MHHILFYFQIFDSLRFSLWSLIKDHRSAIVRKEYARSTWLSHSSSLERARSEVVTWCCCALLQPTLQLAKFFISEPARPATARINRAPHLLSLIGVIVGTIPQAKINRPDRETKGRWSEWKWPKVREIREFLKLNLRFIESL